MALPDHDSFVGHSFGLEIDGIIIKQITEVTGLKMEQDVIELKQNTPDGKYIIKKLPGRWKAGEVTLTRGLTDDQSFEKWIKDVAVRQDARRPQGRRDHRLRLRGQRAVKRYKLTNAWPKSLEIGSLKAGDTSVLTEKLVVTYETTGGRVMRRTPGATSPTPADGSPASGRLAGAGASRRPDAADRVRVRAAARVRRRRGHRAPRRA